MVRVPHDQVLLPVAQRVRQHARFALVNSGSRARPVRFVDAFLVFGVAKVADLQLPTAATPDNVPDVI